MTIQRYDIYANCDSTTSEVENKDGPHIRVDDLVKYLHEQIKISDTNRKAYDEECQHLEKHSNEWQWKIVESIKSEAELNAFILVLQALGKNPIKEIK